MAATLALAGGVALVIALLAPGGGSSVHVAANSVAVIDPGSRRLLGVPVAVGARPGPLAQVAGSVWVANLDDRTITEIDAGARQAVGAIARGGPISDMTAAGKSLLISEVGAGVAQWDPTVKAVTKRTPMSVYDHPGSLQSDDTPQPVAVDASSLWVGQYGAVTRYDITGTRRLALIKGVDNVNAIAVGAGGTWVSDTGNDVVSKIEGDTVVGNPIPTGAGPGAIAVGDGAVWVAERFDNKLARIDPSTDRVTTEIPVGVTPSALAVIGHSVWVANSGDGTLSEIDARTNHVAHTLRIGNSPAGLAAINGRLWVSVQAPAADVAAPTGGVARVAFKDDPGSLDPALALTFANLQIPNATCANLYNYSDASGAAASRIIPEVARGMPSVSEDGSRYTITIRRGFRFSPPSGEPVTTETFRRVIERTLSPRWHASVMDVRDAPDIVGLRAYQREHARHISGLSASGDRLTIRLTHPDPVLAQRLALPVFCAVPDNAPVAERPRLPMAGPYYVSAYRPGQQIVLSRNPNYGGQRPAHLNTIDITIGEPPATSIARVIAGTEDYYAAPPASANAMTATETDRLRTRYGATRGATRPHFFEHPSTWVQYLVFNTARGPFDDARLRRAVNFALDRDAIAAEPSAGLVERPTDQYLSPGLPGFRDVPIYPPGGDLPQALRLAGRGHRHAVLIVDKNAPFLQRAQIVKANLAKIGIDVDIQALSVADKFKRESRTDANWDLAPTGWTPDFADPSHVLNALLRGSHLPPEFNVNYAHFDDPAYNHRLDAAARLTAPARYTTYATLDADLAGKAAPMAALGVWPNRDLFSARIGCQHYQPLYGIDLAALCVKPQ